MNGERRLAVIAGSGMGKVADGFHHDETIPFAEIDGVGQCTVRGHLGEVRLCRSATGRFAVVLGRRHFYEGSADAVGALIAWLAGRGTTHILSLSAAGALTTKLEPGDLVLADGIIDDQNRSTPAPVTGGAMSFPGRPARRLRCDSDLSRAVESAAKDAGVAVHRGTIVCSAGPVYETSAEVWRMQRFGADLATMSAAPEVAFATSAGLGVAVLAVITNPATGILHAIPGHDEVVEQAARAAGPVGRIISELVVT